MKLNNLQDSRSLSHTTLSTTTKSTKGTTSEEARIEQEQLTLMSGSESSTIGPDGSNASQEQEGEELSTFEELDIPARPQRSKYWVDTHYKPISELGSSVGTNSLRLRYK